MRRSLKFSVHCLCCSRLDVGSRYQILENANRELYCSYPQSLATLFASLACGISSLAQVGARGMAGIAVL